VRRGRGGAAGQSQQLKEIYFCATRDPKSGLVYLKVVNISASARRINVQISGAKSVNAKGEAVVLAAKSLEDTNSINEPEKVVPRTEKVDGLGADFVREFPAYSVTVLKFKTK
jgi:alpha-N-arabinofuranosidase